MQVKEYQKVVFVSLSIHTDLEHEEHTQKKKKKPRSTYTRGWTTKHPLLCNL